MCQPVDKALRVRWWAKLSCLEGRAGRSQGITQIKYKTVAVLRGWKCELRDGENKTRALDRHPGWSVLSCCAKVAGAASWSEHLQESVGMEGAGGGKLGQR